jgi:putative ABC transport system substrate-binding protein
MGAAAHAQEYKAQQARKMARVALLSDESPSLSSELLSSETLLKALRDLGWVEGENVTFKRRYSAGKNEILPGLAAELVHVKVDVIVAIGTPAARAAKNATETIPVDLGPKRLELLRETISGVAQVGVLWDPSFPPAVAELKEIEGAARSLRVVIWPLGVQRPDEFEGALLAMTTHHAAALIVVSGRVFTQHRHRLAELTTKARLPMMSYRREVAEAGGLMSYGPNYPDMDRRAATYVDKILKGAKPNDLPVEQPAKVEFVINLKTAKALGLTIPPSLLQRADQVIE